MDDKQKRKRIRLYFSGAGCGWQAALLVIGAIAILVGLNTRDGEMIALLGLLLGIWGGIASLGAVSRWMSRPGYKQIDEWFEEDLQKVSQHALTKLDLSTALLAGECEEGGRIKPLRVIGPILWSTPGVPDNDRLWRKDKDELVRFSIYKIVLIYTAKHLLAAYSCDFNTLRNVMLNEETYEFHYQDIVSVSTRETSTSYTLPNNEKLVFAQEFKVSVSSGESIDVIVDSPTLFKMTKGNVYYKNEVDQTVSRLRNLLRDRKQTATQPVPVAPVYAAPSPVMPSVSEASDRPLQVASPAEKNPAPIAVMPPPPQGQDNHFCSNCGRELKPDEHFCPGCGKQVGA